MRITILVFLSSILINTLSASTDIIRVELFNNFIIKTLIISPIEGKYLFVTDKGGDYKLKKNNIVYFTIIRDSISVWDHEQHLGIFKWIEFTGTARVNAFKIESALPSLSPRYYEGDLRITAGNNELEIENRVPIESYLAGVVESESGPNALYEFYKTQAIISRTYLLAHILKQGQEDYKIGDDVNHQVYKSMSLQNPLIKQAVTHTNGLVIVDTLNQLITATFHSNSGGQTLNSEEVWLSETSYLKGTTDPFSLEQRNTYWQDTILVTDWLRYLAENGVDISDDTAKIDNLYFEQDIRKKYYAYKQDTVPLRKIRADFKLRSTWFSIKPEGNYIIITGKGYGHGVGLSQEGAMQMARQNYSFIDIINYYYKNVKVINYHQLLP
jgi:stage II sporulation protein D